MKTGKGVFIAVESILAAASVLFAALMLTGGSTRKPAVSVVLENSGGNGWASLKYGMTEAAKDYDVNLTIAGTDMFSDSDAMDSVMQNEIRGGANALIVWPETDDKTEQVLLNAAKQVPVVTVGSSGGTDLPCAGTEDYALGGSLAEEIRSDFGGSLEGKTIGILIDNWKDPSQKARQQGLTDGLKGSGVRLVWALDREKLADNDQKTAAVLSEAQYAVDIIAALSDRDLQEVGETAENGNLHGAVLYGFGSSTAAVSLVDRGEAEAVLVPDLFRMGYEAVRMARNSLGSGSVSSVEVSGRILDRDSIFDEENQQILYALTRE